MSELSVAKVEIALEKKVAQARAYLAASIETKLAAAQSCLPAVVEAAELVAASLRNGGRLLVCGNGGSAADSQHLAAELVSSLFKHLERPAISAIALTTDSSIITAIANDYGYNAVFQRQVEGLGRDGDVLLGISTSGESQNVLRALEAAAKKKMKCIALTGGTGGRLRELADLVICVPSDNTQHIQETHLVLEHLLCILIESTLFGTTPLE